MVCDPNDNTLNPPNLGPPPDGYFGPIFAPPQIPFPDISLPEGIPNDILDILNQIFLQIPGGRIIPNVDGAFDSVYDAVGKLMNAFAPYMAFYSFIQALLNIIICIIEVLCALINPFKVIKAIRRLFKQCIPDFLSMFPWIALIAMILAFILMLLALIEYLINTQKEDGTWDEEEFTGTGFPKIFYLRYHMYRSYFPLLALSRYRNMIE